MLVLAATNRPAQLDTALLRPGRFDVQLYVPPPDTDGRLQALQVHCRELALDDSVDLAAVAAATEHFTGMSAMCIMFEAKSMLYRAQLELP